MATHDWSETLGIARPTLESVAGHREANTFALLLVALLERGAPMTLADVATRFEEAGIAPRSRALLSLQRCKPARAPVYRDGDLYQLDPHDHDLELWVFRLGLRPPKVVPAKPRLVPPPVPGPDTALDAGELDEAWKGASLSGWSETRLAIAVLDAHGGPMAPEAVVSAVGQRTKWHALRASSAKFRRRGSVIDVLADGRWAIASHAADTVEKTRVAVRERVELARRHAAFRTDPAAFEQWRVEQARRKAARGAERARMSRAVLVTFPPTDPQAAALLDIGKREVATFVGPELRTLRSQLATYDMLAAVDVRACLRALDFDPGGRRLAELGPPQKTKQLNRQGRTLKLTTALLVQGSCGISAPFGDPKKLDAYLGNGEETKLRRRLEADAKSLYALYEYGCLHGSVRLRWGFLDESISAPWVHMDDPTLFDLEREALETNTPLEIVIGSAPGWSDPWARARLASVEGDPNGWRTWIVDETGFVVQDADVQAARLYGATQ